MACDQKRMMLLHLVWGHHSLNCSEPVVPRIPQNTILGEDTRTKRICAAPTLDACLTGIGPTIIGTNACLKIMHEKKTDLEHVTFPFTVVQFQVNCNEVMYPEEVQEFVPDALLSQEHWITKSIVPTKVTHLWMTGGKVLEKQFSFEAEKLRYWSIKDSVWSAMEQKPDPEFLMQIMDATKEWLKQDLS